LDVFADIEEPGARWKKVLNEHWMFFFYISRSYILYILISCVYIWANILQDGVKEEANKQVRDKELPEVATRALVTFHSHPVSHVLPCKQLPGLHPHGDKLYQSDALLWWPYLCPILVWSKYCAEVKFGHSFHCYPERSRNLHLRNVCLQNQCYCLLEGLKSFLLKR
jgi:hypothetical protein